MKMTRTVYHIAGKDYEANQPAQITFFVQTVSIQNFIALVKKNHCSIVSISGFTCADSIGDYKVKAILVKGFPDAMVNLALALGKREHDELRDNWTIRNSALRNTRKWSRYPGILCFDPVTKTTTMKSNSPVKIEGRQAIINGKLWRKYYDASMR